MFLHYVQYRFIIILFDPKKYMTLLINYTLALCINTTLRVHSNRNSKQKKDLKGSLPLNLPVAHCCLQNIFMNDS